MVAGERGDALRFEQILDLERGDKHIVIRLNGLHQTAIIYGNEHQTLYRCHTSFD